MAWLRSRQARDVYVKGMRRRCRKAGTCREPSRASCSWDSPAQSLAGVLLTAVCRSPRQPDILCFGGVSASAVPFAPAGYPTNGLQLGQYITAVLERLLTAKVPRYRLHDQADMSLPSPDLVRLHEVDTIACL